MTNRAVKKFRKSLRLRVKFRELNRDDWIEDDQNGTKNSSKTDTGRISSKPSELDSVAPFDGWLMDQSVQAINFVLSEIGKRNVMDPRTRFYYKIW